MMSINVTMQRRNYVGLLILGSVAIILVSVAISAKLLADAFYGHRDVITVVKGLSTFYIAVVYFGCFTLYQTRLS